MATFLCVIGACTIRNKASLLTWISFKLIIRTEEKCYSCTYRSVTKQVYAIWEQQRRRSGCATTQFISVFIIRCLYSIMSSEYQESTLPLKLSRAVYVYLVAHLRRQVFPWRCLKQRQCGLHSCDIHWCMIEGNVTVLTIHTHRDFNHHKS